MKSKNIMIYQEYTKWLQPSEGTHAHEILQEWGEIIELEYTKRADTFYPPLWQKMSPHGMFYRECGHFYFIWLF